jgi:hypothetical protein
LGYGCICPILSLVLIHFQVPISMTNVMTHVRLDTQT